VSGRRAGGGAMLALAGAVLAGAAGKGVAEPWTPPLGVPAPAFGIAEVAGSRTHYVDNTHPRATDVDNPDGSPERPRMSVPPSLPEGSVVEVRGGPYGGPTRLIWTAAGTGARPVFVRGVGRPEVRGLELRLAGSYAVVEGFVFVAAPVRLRGDHLSFRGNVLRGFSPPRHNAALSGIGSDLVIHGNEIHGNGDAAGAREVDIHGIKFATGTERLWIVDNHIHHNGGDAVQIGGATTEPWAHHVYIARNELHEDRENAVDIKQARDVVISQNRAWGYRAVSSSDGTAVVVHDNPDRVWVLFNEIHSSVNGVRNNGSTASYVVGNVIRNIHHDPAERDYDPDDAWGTGSAVISWRTGDLYVVHNTFFDVDAGIRYPDRSGRLHLANNVMGGLSERGPHVAIARPTVAEASTLSHSLLQAPTRLNWGGERHDLRSFRRAFRAQCQGCLDRDPLFVAADDLRLRAGSPAVDAGTTHPLYDLFLRRYGLSIARDHAGRPRPQGAGWDLGAFER
jgi:hypothetical protein